MRRVGGALAVCVLLVLSVACAKDKSPSTASPQAPQSALPTDEEIRQRYLAVQITEAEAQAAFQWIHPEWQSWQMQATMDGLRLQKNPYPTESIVVGLARAKLFMSVAGPSALAVLDRNGYVWRAAPRLSQGIATGSWIVVASLASGNQPDLVFIVDDLEGKVTGP